MKGIWKSQKNLSRLERKLAKQKTRVELTSGRIAEEVYNRLIELEDIEAIRKLKAGSFGYLVNLDELHLLKKISYNKKLREALL